MATFSNIKVLNKMMAEHGQDSTMSAKKTVWKIKGLDRRLGRYVGTPAQVNAMIKSLKNNPLPSFTNMSGFNYKLPTGETIYDQMNPSQAATVDVRGVLSGAVASNVPKEILEYAKTQGTYDPVKGNYSFPDYVYNPNSAVQQRSGTPNETPATEAEKKAAFAQQGVPYMPGSTIPEQPKPIQPVPQVAGTAGTTTDPRTQALNWLTEQGYGSPDEKEIEGAMEYLGLSKSSTSENIPKNILDAATSAISAGNKAVADAQNYLTSRGITPATGTSATTGTSQPSGSTNADGVLNQIMGTSAYKNLQDTVTLKNQMLEGNAELERISKQQSFETTKTNLENRLAENGLAFSGIRAESVQKLVDNLAASNLAIDRTLASKLLEVSSSFQDTVLDMVSDIIKEAEAGDKENIDQLNKLGYAVVNGTLYEIPSKKDYISVGGGLYDKTTDSWIVPPKEEKTYDVEGFSNDVARGKITLSGVPNAIQTQVSKRADELKQNLTEWADDEIRSWIRAKVQEFEGNLPDAEDTKSETKQRLLDLITSDQGLYPKDKARFLLIINEYGNK